MVKKILIGVVLAVLVAATVMFFYIGPRNVIGIMTYGQQARDGSLQVGDDAPMVALVGLDGTDGHAMNAFVDDKPLVLVFGSFT